MDCCPRGSFCNEEVHILDQGDPDAGENSLIAIRYALNQYILPTIGGYRLRDITPMQIQAIMAGLSGKSNSVQSKVLINLRSIFNTAQENGLVAKSPVSNMLKPGGRKTPEKEVLRTA